MANTFADLGLPDILTTTLSSQGITEPFPIQAATIPDVLEGKDVSGRAPTGSGKTLAFGLPILARVELAEPNRPKALVLAPTRELAAQIRLDLAPYGKATDRQVFAVFGGVRYHPQKTWLSRGVDVLVATPGRLEDLMEQEAVDLSDVEIVTVDEADRMADMGFLPDVERILDKTRTKRQTLLFSATLDGDVAVLTDKYQRNPVRHDAGAAEHGVYEAEHHFWLVHHNDKVRYTAEVIKIADRSIVFARTRHGVDRLARQLASNGVVAVAMHGGLSQNQRHKALKAFAIGDAQALVATDVAARGIHIDAVASVVHFDPPADAKDYVHRSGRTARAGATGNIVSLITSEQRRTSRRMQDVLGMHEPIGKPDPGSLHEHHISELKASEPKPAPAHEPTAWPAPRPIRTPEPTPPGANTIHVSNLPWSATDDELTALFSRHGTVVQATVMIDNRGRSKGYGLVDMPRAEAGRTADALNGHTMAGRQLKVRLSR